MSWPSRIGEPAYPVAWAVFLRSVTGYPRDESEFAFFVSKVTPAAGRGTPHQEMLHNAAIREWREQMDPNGTQPTPDPEEGR